MTNIKSKIVATTRAVAIPTREAATLDVSHNPLPINYYNLHNSVRKGIGNNPYIKNADVAAEQDFDCLQWFYLQKCRSPQARNLQRHFSVVHTKPTSITNRKCVSKHLPGRALVEQGSETLCTCVQILNHQALVFVLYRYVFKNDNINKISDKNEKKRKKM